MIAAERLRLKISGCILLSIVMPATKMKRMETCMHEVCIMYFIFNDNQTVLPLFMSAVCPSRLALVSYSQSLRTLIAKVSRIRRLLITQIISKDVVEPGLICVSALTILLCQSWL